MREILRRFLKIVFKNWSTLLCFELIYRAIGFSVVGPLLRYLFSCMPAASGFAFLSQENISSALANPRVILLLLLSLILASAYVYFELTALVLYCDRSWQGIRMPLFGLWRDTFRHWIRIFLPCNLPVFLLLLPALALSSLPLSSGALNAVKVPEFIVEFIRQKPALSILYGLLLLALNLAGFRYLFGLPYAVLQKERFTCAWRKSGALLKGRIWKTALLLALCFLITASAAFLAAVSAILLLFVYTEATGGGEETFRFLVASWERTGRLAASILAPAVLAAVSVLSYRRYRGDVPPDTAPEKKTVKRILRRAAIIAGSVILLLFISETAMGGAGTRAAGKDTLIVAHRAGAVLAPENTVAALEQAIDDGADMAEIDVQQTKDGILIIMHDSNLKRTTGADLNVRDAEYSRIKGLDAGFSASSKFKGEPVPTLEEMLQAAKGRIKLMIELKATGHETGLVEQTAAAVRREGMEDECVIASMDLSLLQQTRQLDPELTTVYITALLLTRAYDLEDVDGYSIETTSLTPEMAAQIHAQGKKLYIWTANSGSGILRILRSEADGLITDNPALARFYMEEGSDGLFLDELTQWFYPTAALQK